MTVFGWLASCLVPADDPGRLARIEAMTASYDTRFPGVPEVGAAELRDRLERGEPLVLVDVRSEEERRVSTLPGAVRSEDVEAHPERFAGQKLVAYCTIGERSGWWALKEREAGLDVANLRGSVLAWTHAGGPLVDPDGRPTKRVHVYGWRWDLARTDYQATW